MSETTESSVPRRSGYRNLGSRGRGPARRPGFRSRSQMRSDNRSDNKAAMDFVADVATKTGTATPHSIQKKNPGKENPDPSQPMVKLEHYTSDWVETDRKNIQVELREDFEDNTIMQHTDAIAYDTDALQYDDPANIASMLLAFYGYSYCCVAYRLIITVPSSQRSSVADFLREMRDAEQLLNTPAICEMLHHLGKSDIPYYGKLRIDSPLLMARRRISRAIYILRNTDPFHAEFQFNRDQDAENLINFRMLVWNDLDSLDWCREQARIYVQDQLKIERDLSAIRDDIRNHYPDNDEALTFSYPFIDVNTKRDDGTRRYITPTEVMAYWRKLTPFKKPEYDRFMACLILLSVSHDYFAKGDKALETDNPEWRQERFADFPYLRTTAIQIADYMGLRFLNLIMDDRKLRYNYHIIVNNFRAAFLPRFRRIFDFTHVSKEEFGDEAQALLCIEANPTSNPLISSQFQFRDRQKIAAGGIFKYAYRVRHSLAETMLMKRTRTSMVKEIVNKFARK